MRALIPILVIFLLCGCDPEKKSTSKIEALEQAGESQKYALGMACMEYISQHGKDLPYSKTLLRKMIDTGFFAETINAVELLLEKFSGDPELFYLRSIAYRNQHQYALALKDLQYALRFQPHNRGFSQEAIVLDRQHQLWNEIEGLNQSLSHSTDSFSVLLNRAEKFFQMREYDAVLYDLGAMSKMRSPADSIYYAEKVSALYKDNRRPVDMLAEMLQYFRRR